MLGVEKPTLDVVCVLAHPLGFFQLAADDEFARVELLPDVVQVDQPVLALERQQLRGLPRTCPSPKRTFQSDRKSRHLSHLNFTAKR